MSTASFIRRVRRLERRIPVKTPMLPIEFPLPQIARKLLASIANLDVDESVRLSAEDKLIDESIEAVQQFYAEYSGFQMSAENREEFRAAFEGGPDEVRYKFARKLLEAKT